MWYANCPWCGLIAEHAYSWLGAMGNAIEHATEEPCSALRLAALLARLEGLRDKLREGAGKPYMTETANVGVRAAKWDAADDLDAIIREATR